ncbi:Proteophosphoglycan 5 [Rhodotorula toruloides]|uniref:Proteophosphoglycan 5 n=2 Tax=Rhodotorula toruloides TaxID=5286 RepID=A0A2T0A750_RHOTO|nr:Proteophosphoglycan 5 [Rhodotorula toruloides]PRQ73830.1 Proteophosphoglycan 5 [Rhodotorula toruloides]
MAAPIYSTAGMDFVGGMEDGRFVRSSAQRAAARRDETNYRQAPIYRLTDELFDTVFSYRYCSWHDLHTCTAISRRFRNMAFPKRGKIAPFEIKLWLVIVGEPTVIEDPTSKRMFRRTRDYSSALPIRGLARRLTISYRIRNDIQDGAPLVGEGDPEFFTLGGTEWVEFDGFPDVVQDRAMELMDELKVASDPQGALKRIAQTYPHLSSLVLVGWPVSPEMAKMLREELRYLREVQLKGLPQGEAGYLALVGEVVEAFRKVDVHVVIPQAETVSSL